MSRRTGFFVISLLMLAVLGLTLLTASKMFTASSAQAAQSSGEQTLQALLGEVHELRVTLQRANLNTYHAQITIERLKLQQQRVDRLQAQLGEIRKQLAETRNHLDWLPRHVKNAEMELAKETDVAKHADKEKGLQNARAELEETTRKEQQQQASETQLNAQLQSEQAKLAELNERLDTLQRELETQMATDKPQSGKRQH